MYNKPINSFIDELMSINSEMNVSYAPVSPSFTFSNTGRRGVKYFSITLNQMISVLNDIKANISEFMPYVRYEETPWRDRFHSHISDEVVNALSTVQTLPLFNLINKIIYTANMLTTPFDDKIMPLSSPNVDVAINYLTSQIADEEAYINSLSKGSASSSLPSISTSVTSVAGGAVGTNKIYYGAPGTGKSYRIKNEIGSATCLRTVFHPDTQYADFVGTLKPRTSVSTSGEQIITYEFRPGPFTRAFIEAFQRKDAGEPVYLVIEEINRASAAAVFGELFQLLDRKADGSSEYSIDVSDPDMQAYINSKLGISIASISLPSNLFLLATMNSSDQAVKPMDTAFKRRWSFEHIPIDYSKATTGELSIPLTGGSTVKIEWGAFAEAVNHQLKKLQIPEDRLLGHRFLSEPELSSADTAINTLCGKLFVYLWDDVLRHGRRELIFNNEEFHTFGELVNNFKQGKAVFSEELEEILSSLMKTEEVYTETEVVADEK